jgi:acetolactate synthase regulatory subunit
MSFDLEMTLSRQERAFERVVGLVGRRGYEIVGVVAQLHEDGRSMAVRLTLESERAPELLSTQLQKLQEVADVRFSHR